MKTVTSDDATLIAFDQWGSGPALILVDGAFCYRAYGPTPKLAPLLARHFTVFAYDRRGRGDSGDARDYSVEREIEDLKAVARSAGKSPPPLTATDADPFSKHFTGSNALDLYYMPYTHSLVAALFWSCAGGIIYQFVARPSSRQASVVVASAVFSHWVLDLIVHVPDLPLYDNSAKVGLGLWNAPLLSFGLEAALLLGGIWLCLRARLVRRGTLLFGVLMLAIQAYNMFLGPPPKSDRAFAVTALIAYAVFAIVIWLLEDRRAIARAASL